MERGPSSLDEIVDRQVRRWISSKTKKGAGREMVPVLPCITISRQFGALGGALGKALADDLGFTCWDQELVHAVARRSGMDEQMLATVDEQTRTTIDLFIDGLLRGRTYSEGEYLRQIGRLIQTISAHGSGIIVGRGGQFLLDSSETLHVRTVCPLGPRIRGVAQRRGVSESEAKSIIEKGEKERQAFIQKHYGRDVTDPATYDLTVNVGSFSVEKAVQIVKTAYENRFGDVPEKRVEKTSLPPLIMPVPRDD